MSIAAHHAEWLSLIEVSGPFLTPPVLLKVFPQGLEDISSDRVGRLRLAYEEWLAIQESSAPDAVAIHAEWIRFVLQDFLGLEETVLKSGTDMPSNASVSAPEHGEHINPDYVVLIPRDHSGAGKIRLLVRTLPYGQKLDEPISGSRWSASPLERMTFHCREAEVCLGLVTNGEQWTLVDAPRGEMAGYSSWCASHWFEERITLRAFYALLRLQRFFGVSEDETLESMLAESVNYQAEVTDQLGFQVRKAVEVLVQALDRADVDRKRTLLEEVNPKRLYEAALTVMMRLVFLFCAEERGLLLLDDSTYNDFYAISPLRAFLRQEADRLGVEVLERRYDAWARILAAVRAVYGGLEHDTLRLPALGGSLFDPDRFPFLEGRAEGTTWRDTLASPLPIDNRTVLHLLESLQLLRGKGSKSASEARRLSFKALDVEQIGYVYEGLLDHEAIRVKAPTLGLSGTKNKEPEVSLDDLEGKKAIGEDEVIDFLKEHTGRSKSALKNALSKEPERETSERLLVACGNDEALRDRTMPFHALIRDDVWGVPQVYQANAYVVTAGTDRRQTGTHYTPQSLTEEIVRETLEPIVYDGPSRGAEQKDWKLKFAEDLLDLKICDMAMGSGAFLVQVCRFLSERVVEAWGAAEESGKSINSDGRVVGKKDCTDPMPKDLETRLAEAHRLVAERCLYGVDINPMAVELAKLSIWLVTLSKGRPFGFLDHNLRSGDSLLGLWNIEQLRNLHPDPERGKRLHQKLVDYVSSVDRSVANALEKRKALRSIRILDIHDVEEMARLEQETNEILRDVHIVADLVLGAALTHAGASSRALDDGLVSIGMQAAKMFVDDSRADAYRRQLKVEARKLINVDLPENNASRQPFHWAIEFPEVFCRSEAGFDAIVGNPPFMGGQKLTGTLGTKYREYLVEGLGKGQRGSADLVAYFYLAAYQLISNNGNFGLLAVNTIMEGDTKEVGVDQLLAAGAVVYAAHLNEPWSGRAAVVTSRLCIHKGDWSGPQSPIAKEEWKPKKLKANEGIAFQGSIVLGMGFVVTEEEALGMIERDSRNKDVLFPYLNGEDLNSHPEQKPSRWVINFWDWPEEKAKTYPEPYAIVREKVKPERDKCNRKARRERWWQHAEQAKGLYHAIGRGQHFVKHPKGWDAKARPREKVLVCSEVTKFLCFAFVSNTFIMSANLDAFQIQSNTTFAQVQSAIHEVWARKQSSKLETRLKYSPGNAFETFPFPALKHIADLERLGSVYHERRSMVMSEEGIGMTDLYNRFHDPNENGELICELRKLHKQIDEAVAHAYGWDDLDLGQDFQEVSYLSANDRMRYTISEPARMEVLSRLIALNKERYEEEVKQGLHGSKSKSSKGSSVKGRASKAAGTCQMDIYGGK